VSRNSLPFSGNCTDHVFPLFLNIQIILKTIAPLQIQALSPRVPTVTAILHQFLAPSNITDLLATLLTTLLALTCPWEWFPRHHRHVYPKQAPRTHLHPLGRLQSHLQTISTVIPICSLPARLLCHQTWSGAIPTSPTHPSINRHSVLDHPGRTRNRLQTLPIPTDTRLAHPQGLFQACPQDLTVFRPRDLRELAPCHMPILVKTASSPCPRRKVSTEPTERLVV
jgi:hypothetical protein